MRRALGLYNPGSGELRDAHDVSTMCEKDVRIYKRIMLTRARPPWVVVDSVEHLDDSIAGTHWGMNDQQQSLH